MAITRLQSNVTPSAGSPVLCAFPGNLTANSLVIVAARNNNGNATMTVTGTNLTYTWICGAYAAQYGNAVAIYYAFNTAGVVAETVTVGDAGASYRATISEYSGLVTSNVVDQSGVTQAGTGTQAALGSGLTTTQADELLFAAFAGVAYPADVAAGSGYGRLLRDVAGTCHVASCDQVVSATGTFGADLFDWTGSTNYAVALATFKALGGGGGGIAAPWLKL